MSGLDLNNLIKIYPSMHISITTVVLTEIRSLLPTIYSERLPVTYKFIQIPETRYYKTDLFIIGGSVTLSGIA
jgi:hypothetical protein